MKKIAKEYGGNIATSSGLTCYYKLNHYLYPAGKWLFKRTRRIMVMAVFDHNSRSGYQTRLYTTNIFKFPSSKEPLFVSYDTGSHTTFLKMLGYKVV